MPPLPRCTGGALGVIDTERSEVQLLISPYSPMDLSGPTYEFFSNGQLDFHSHPCIV
jgi:hypothetical protein